MCKLPSSIYRGLVESADNDADLLGVARSLNKVYLIDYGKDLS